MEQSLTLPVSQSIPAVSGKLIVPDTMRALLLLAHGAGAGMDHRFMKDLATTLADVQLGTLRFNFPYMEAGKKFPGSPASALDAYIDVIRYAQTQFPETPLFLAGKSYGGRMASHVMTESRPGIRGLVYYGFPLHPAGKPDTKRAEHLSQIQLPMLFLQGEKDTLADLHLLQNVVGNLSNASLILFPDTDHSFNRPKKLYTKSLIPTLAQQTRTWVDQIL